MNQSINGNVNQRQKLGIINGDELNYSIYNLFGSSKTAANLPDNRVSLVWGELVRGTVLLELHSTVLTQ